MARDRVVAELEGIVLVADAEPAAKPLENDDGIEPVLSAVTLRSTSWTVCLPVRSMSSRVNTWTGAAVSASMRLMRDPVISTLSSCCCCCARTCDAGSATASPPNARATLRAIGLILSFINTPPKGFSRDPSQIVDVGLNLQYDARFKGRREPRTSGSILDMAPCIGNLWETVRPSVLQFLDIRGRT